MKQFFLVLLLSFSLKAVGQQVLPPGKITYAEYFIDQKPDAGTYGTGTPISFDAANEIDIMVEIPTQGLAPGLHQLYVNVSDAEGRWSSSVRMFTVQENTGSETPTLPPGEVNYAEYFIDQKPDAATYGTGIPISFDAANEIDIMTDISLGGLSAGLHQLYVNVSDAEGRWSSTTRMFTIQENSVTEIPTLPPGKLNYAEYFIDQKPDAGTYGSGTPIPFEAANEIDLMADITLDGLSPGLHQLYVNVRDSVGRWSSAIRMFTIQENKPGITSVKFLFDQANDLSQAITITFPATQELDTTFRLNVGPLTIGQHQLIGLLESEAGFLSHPDTAAFTVVDCDLPDEPVKPIGFSQVSMCDGSSSYSTNTVPGATSYLWILSNPDAGTVSATNNNAQITWESGFNGQAQLVVQAENSCGTGNYSDALVIERTDLIPCAPSDFVATSSTDLQADLSWTDNSTNETGFVIERSTDNISFSQVTITTPGQTSYTDALPMSGTTYYYRLYAQNGVYSSTAVLSQLDITTPGTFNLNYIKISSAKEPYSDISGWDTKPVDQIQVLYQYFDGLGRPIQTVTKEGTPNRKDIVQPIVYDKFGRIAKEYLSYAVKQSDGTSGGFRQEAIEEQLDYYKLLFDDDTRAYTTTGFDNSPLNRVTSKTAPGSAWQTHPSTFNYGTNSGTEIIWTVDASGNLVKGATYAAGELYKTITTDEDGHTGEEYKDKAGKVVLTIAGGNAKTYYVYDDFGLLRWVLPPKACADNNISSIEATELCYYYNYDERKRMIEKKIPGTAPIYMVYDKRDLLVASQDGELRKTDQWLFTKYDRFRRPIITGIYQAATDATPDDIKTLVDGATAIWEIYDKTENSYSNDAFPDVTNCEIYSETYYDSKDYAESLGENYQYTNTQVYNDMHESNKTKGQIMATKTHILLHDGLTVDKEWLNTVNIYDKYGRIIQAIADNHKGGRDIVSNKYNFAGELLESKQEHTNSTIIIDKVFDYDHMGRLLNEKETLNKTGMQVVTSDNVYNELGQLITNKIGGSIQTVDYKYNIRGWMTHINDPASLGSDLFAMQLKYNNGTTPTFNGNISQIDWKSKTYTDLKSYKYKYDALNRLDIADFANDNYKVDYDYDLNGNITSLTRHGKKADGTFDIIDNLSYSYSGGGNQLSSVLDAGSATDGFSDNGSVSDNEYTYDDNGNLFTDGNKNITNINYNFLNLPNQVQIATGASNQINYIYDAAGIKLRKEAQGITTDYIGNFIYEDDVLKYILTSNGRIVVDGSNYNYQYHIKDHLGNTRVTFDATGNVLQEDSYYPFGMVMNGYNYTLLDPEDKNKYLYNGKELQDDLGVNWYDYGARFYDAQLARFHSVDNFSEKYSNLSPYNYVANNPMNSIDINGDSIWYTRNDNVITMHITGKVYNGSDDDIDMDEAISDMKDALADAFSGEFEDGGKTYEFTTDIQLEEAKSMDDVEDSDHLVVLANGKEEPGYARGATSMDGGKVIHAYSGDYPSNAWYSPGWSTTKTVVHEFGHAAGLKHTSSGLMKQGGSSESVSSKQLKSMLGARTYINKGPNTITNPYTGKKSPYPYLHYYNAKRKRYERAHVNSVGLTTK